ncbi:8d14abf3-3061-4cec-add8-0451b92ea2d8 [Thermothielavioides terrestris]|uniref:SWR1-complex protein 3 domain-containing protein n=2 Tax=Thermothielavioides terrestris TaxID=2587410 RepID=G2R8A2_THETT|nr:uncharacterized protein THITE_2117577 [Thermothielavioides terrestris NRRL 8126]AEO68161.1 hypothetical protein THITE_2117577 [Thermothielavioides terrestris NRRL 8126]SPQ24591.1 8d14abf3-3061-4cec-add8-0451b92ea2d8 [Thermothielavioides terrestris]
MEKKRKLPARAAARAEQAAKRRTMTPPQRSVTPAPPATAAAPEPDPAPAGDAPSPLPQSIAAGKPLPTVDSPQPDDLSSTDYQSVTESGVLAESLSRSRHKWTMEGIFEKYWSKPTKRKGVVIEEPNNPPKESMTKLGQVTITVEPHVFEATMYAVKDPKPPPPPAPPTERPVLQYGPPNGVMPPPPTPTTNAAVPTASATATATPTPTPPPTQAQAQAPVPPDAKPPINTQVQTPTQTPTLSAAQPAVGQPTPEIPRPAPAMPVVGPRPVASPRGMESVLSPSTVAPIVPQKSPTTQPQPPRPTPPLSSSVPSGPIATADLPKPVNTAVEHPVPNGATPAGSPAKPAPGTDPIILTLAAKAGTDPQLRDLMKRVAQGAAAKHELERFQAIIDAITAESERNGGTAGPSADRLLVDGRTVRYFADEVRAILDIVLRSNPKQTSADLRPPAGSDPLVVMLVKAALDDFRTRDMVRRIAENKPHFSDATDLKVILDSLRAKLLKDNPQQQSQQPQSQQQHHGQPPSSALPGSSKANGTSNTQPTPSTAAPQPPPPQQALRSKGPPPPPAKPDISAIVFEFAGGTGDRYLFPKFSLLEYVPVPTGQQVIASFLLVLKGSRAEYPVADPKSDYYEPLTIRLFTHTGRHLEHLARVVAPPDEVRRYMADVMARMTRAEYVLLAMRLPRGGAAEDEGKEKNLKEGKGGDARGSTGLVAGEKDKDGEREAAGADAKAAAQPQAVLWNTKPAKAGGGRRDSSGRGKGYGKAVDADDEQYQSFIASVSRKDG